MANELCAFNDSGLTLYAVLLNSVGQVYNGTTFVSINGANWTSYDIAMTEGTAGIYLATMPTVAAGAYSYVVYSQAGATPAITDTLKGSGSLQWDGSAEVVLSSAATIADAVWDESDIEHNQSRTMGHRIRQETVIRNANTSLKIWDDERAGGLLELSKNLTVQRIEKLDNLDARVSGIGAHIKAAANTLGALIAAIKIPEPYSDPRLDNLDARVSSRMAADQQLSPPQDPRLDRLETISEEITGKIPTAKEIAEAVLDEPKGDHKGWLAKLLSRIEYIARI